MTQKSFHDLLEKNAMVRKEQLKSSEISEDEYFEWKINWPATSSKVDYNGKDDKKCSYNWRKN